MGYDSYNPGAINPDEYTRVGKVTTAAGAQLALAILLAPWYEWPGSAAANDGDIYYFYVIAAGSETFLVLDTYQGTSRGIFDLYINGVLDSAAYDDYAGASAAIRRSITLTIKPTPGLNTIKLVVNGKNAASTDYAIATSGVRLR